MGFPTYFKGVSYIRFILFWHKDKRLPQKRLRKIGYSSGKFDFFSVWLRLSIRKRNLLHDLQIYLMLYEFDNSQYSVLFFNFLFIYTHVSLQFCNINVRGI